MLPETIKGYVNYTAKQGDMMDLIAQKMYGDCRLAGYVIEFNRQYSDVLVFDGGENLKLPIVEAPETEETVAPWKR